MTIDDQAREIAGAEGIDFFGIADLLPARDAIAAQVGPRVRWAAVLTDAPLQATGAALAPGESPGAKCGECRACVEACPAHAFTGRPFRADEGRDARYRAEACNAYVRSVREQIGHRVCGMCVKVCPHGVRAARHAQDRMTSRDRETQ